jgi:catechol 2,3-dioxygenase-like lactoylglutathione lyase family enzyme
MCLWLRATRLRWIALAASGARPLGVYETVLYASDVNAAAAFYRDVLGLSLFEHYPDFAAVFRLDSGGIFLIFEPERSSAPGRALPAHGANGAGHVAFAVRPGVLDVLAESLREHGVEIEVDQTWDWGGHSLYFRDPAGNSVEIVEGEAFPPVSRRPPAAEMK